MLDVNLKAVFFLSQAVGLLGVTRVLALEWAAHGICVNAMAPGYIETPLTRPLFEDPDFSAWIHSRIPMARRGHPADLVGTAIYLCSSASDYVTGQNVVVDGGFPAG